MAGEHGVAGQVKALIMPILAEAQVELVDVEYTREGQVHYLRIFIDKPGGVTIDDCQMISRECEVVLDIEELIQTQYILEVSSPGLDRPLKKREDYERFHDRLVKIRTYRAVDGQKNFLGRLKGLIDDPVTNTCAVRLHVDDDDIQIPYDMIASARLEVEF
ncbi:MAG: ribosome maturation factor RimP [Smithellaceae bacterium]